MGGESDLGSAYLPCMPGIALQESLLPPAAPVANGNIGVFTGNMKLPIHRWFRYSAGFSAQWVEQEIAWRAAKQSIRVFDPFAGSGTTLIAAQATGASACGLESHPFVARVAQAKLAWRTVDPIELAEQGEIVSNAATPIEVPDTAPQLLRKIYEAPALAQLLGLRAAIDSRKFKGPMDQLLWLGLVSILRSCSFVGTAQWQYVLPNKRKAVVAEPLSAFRAKIRLMAEDIASMQAAVETAGVELYTEDARTASSPPTDWANLVITSPPYPNNYDYADAARIEMTFLGEIAGWGDLQANVRSFLLRSCTQHMKGFDPERHLESEELAPIIKELRPIFNELSEVRKSRGGRKSYHSMIVAYFADLAQCWYTLRRIVEDEGEVIFVIGDSAPYGVHVPVERWLGELALAAGFKNYSFEKLRDRNIKWRNRKHRVPLQEGLLRVS